MGSTFESEIENYAYTCLTNEEPRKADQTFHSFFALFKLPFNIGDLNQEHLSPQHNNQAIVFQASLWLCLLVTPLK